MGPSGSGGSSRRGGHFVVTSEASFGKGAGDSARQDCAGSAAPAILAGRQASVLDLAGKSFRCSAIDFAFADFEFDFDLELIGFELTFDSQCEVEFDLQFLFVLDSEFELGFCFDLTCDFDFD